MPRRHSSTRRWPARSVAVKPPATMSRTHAEIQRLADRIGTHLALAQASNGIQPDQVDDLLACLYGLYTLLRLHFLQRRRTTSRSPRTK